MMQQRMAAATAAATQTKKQREVYVGNLTIGVVSVAMLTELFNGALLSILPESERANGAPVISINLDAEGKFGFIEMRTEALATAALHLDKVELCGRRINVGRPRGYVDPNAPPGAAPPAMPHLAAPLPPQVGGLPTPGSLAAAAMGGLGGVMGMPPQLGGGLALAPNNLRPNMPPGLAGLQMPPGAPLPGVVPSAPAPAPPQRLATPPGPYILLENMVTADTLESEQERTDLQEDVRDESAKFGPVVSIAVPKPPPEVAAAKLPGRVYVRFAHSVGAEKSLQALDGRSFDGNKVRATFVPEHEFLSAMNGEWVQKEEGALLVPNLPPGLAPAAPASGPPAGLPPPPPPPPPPPVSAAEDELNKRVGA